MILSVSRRTDIPNYYFDWFLNRIKVGWVYVRNPINPRQVSKINLSPDVVDCIVFWSKNPSNAIDKLDYLLDYKFYFQFTLTCYERDVEPNLPDKNEELIPTFIRLSEKIGKEKVIWRYDPILLNNKYTIDYHINAFEQISARLANYTSKVIVSFIDLYAKTKRNTKELKLQELTDEKKYYLIQKLKQIAEKYNLTIQTCAENPDFQKIGISAGSCIDREYIEKLIGNKLSGSRDKSQREGCMCFESIDIGSYDTCLNGCKYCYANYNMERVQQKNRLYNDNSYMLCEKPKNTDKITERKVYSLKIV